MTFDLLGLGILFLVIAFICYLAGAKGLAGFSMEIAKWLIIIFVVLFVLTIIFGGVLVLFVVPVLLLAG